MPQHEIENAKFFSQWWEVQDNFDELYNSRIGKSVTDYDTIALAVADLSDGDTLYFPNGTYTIASGLTFDNIDDLTVLGDNATILVTDNSGGIVDFAFDFNKCDNVKVSGFNFDLDNSSYVGTSVTAMAFRGCKRIEVKNNHFFNVGFGVELFHDSDAGTINCSDVSVHHNTAENGGGLPMNTANYSNGVIMNKLVRTNLDAAEESLINIEVSNNIVNDSNLAYLQGVENAVVSNNIVNGSPDSTIYLDNLISNFTISGNVLIDSGKDAIKVIQTSGSGSWAATTVNGHGSITGNTIRGSGLVDVGGGNYIYLEGARDVSVTGNSMVFSPTNILSTNAQTGIVIQSCFNINVNGNTIDGKDVSGVDDDCLGILLKAGSGTTTSFSNADLEDITVRNNNITGIMGNGIEVYSGIYIAVVYNLKGLNISDNLIKLRDGGNNGIWLYPSSSSSMTDVNIKNNIIYGAEAYSIRPQANDTCTLVGVQIEGNTFLEAYAATSNDIRINGVGGTYSGRNTLKNNRSDGVKTTMIRWDDSSKDYFRVSGNLDDNTMADGYTAAPTGGTWVIGDKVYDSTPTAGGNIGWICTTAGTPGTWKTFGDISA